MTVLQFTDATTESAGPDGAISTLMDGVNAILRETVCLRVSLGCKHAFLITELSQPTPLTSNPQFILAISSDGVNYFVGQTSSRDSSVFSRFSPVQPTFNRCKPCVIVTVHVHGSRALQVQGTNGISNEGTIPDTFNLPPAAKPYISFAIFEECCHGRVATSIPRKPRSSTAVVSQQSLRRAHP